MIVNIVNNFDVDFTLPITMIDENMDRAHKRDGLLNQKYWFRTNIVKRKDCYQRNIITSTNFCSSYCPEDSPPDADLMEDDFREMTVLEILEGNPALNYKGLYPLFEEFMALKGYPKD